MRLAAVLTAMMEVKATTPQISTLLRLWQQAAVRHLQETLYVTTSQGDGVWTADSQIDAEDTFQLVTTDHLLPGPEISVWMRSIENR